MDWESDWDMMWKLRGDNGDEILDNLVWTDDVFIQPEWEPPTHRKFRWRGKSYFYPAKPIEL